MNLLKFVLALFGDDEPPLPRVPVLIGLRPRIRVTRWTHPSSDTALVLAGTVPATRGQAADYFSESPALAQGIEIMMDEAEFYDL